MRHDNLEIMTINAMRKFGGSFVKNLAECFISADPHNYYKLKTTFQEYWDKYQKMALSYDRDK